MVLPVAAAKHQQECVEPLTSWLDAYQHNEKHTGAQKEQQTTQFVSACPIGHRVLHAHAFPVLEL